MIASIALAILLAGTLLNLMKNEPPPQEEAPPEPGWISPTGYNDPDSGWNSEISAFDDNENSSTTTVPVQGNTWSAFLYFTTSQLTTDRIRVLTTDSNSVCYYDIDVRKDGVWTDIFGGFLPASWYEMAFAKGAVTQMRIRVMQVGPSGIGGSGISYVLQLNEVDFGNSQKTQRNIMLPAVVYPSLFFTFYSGQVMYLEQPKGVDMSSRSDWAKQDDALRWFADGDEKFVEIKVPEGVNAKKLKVGLRGRAKAMFDTVPDEALDMHTIQGNRLGKGDVLV